MAESIAQKTRVNPITRFCKQNELTKLNEDMCYLDRRDHDSRRPFKWQTYHYHPYGSKVESTCYPGQFYNDGHVGGSNVESESKVTRFPGYKMTNPNVHQELPMLPIQIPRLRGYFNSDTESNLRWEANFNNKQCLSDTTNEVSFNKYRFQIFDGLCYNPQENRIPEDTHNKCFKNARFWHRAGEDTRHNRQTRYVNGCNWKQKFFSPNLSYSNFGY